MASSFLDEGHLDSLMGRLSLDPIERDIVYVLREQLRTLMTPRQAGFDLAHAVTQLTKLVGSIIASKEVEAFLSDVDLWTRIGVPKPTGEMAMGRLLQKVSSDRSAELSFDGAGS